MKTVPSPFTPKTFVALPEIAGVKLASVAAGIRYQGRNDLTMMAFDQGSTIAGVFTKSSTAGPPIIWCRNCLKNGEVSAIIINSGNANVFTGDAGHAFVEGSVATTAQLLGCAKDKVFVSSTGVIGELPPIDKMTAGLNLLPAQLNGAGWDVAARAIMTTDTFPKMATRTLQIDGKHVTINGIAKGSGMIAPDMATMLVYLATDAKISHQALQSTLDDCVETTFNAITVDSDTSTSDTLLLAATGKAGNAEIADKNDPSYALFAKIIHDICRDLAHQVIRDGEGVTKFATIKVTGARTNAEAKIVAMSIANSPLVKTAIAGSDPNWGRIMMAIGKAPVKIDQLAITLEIGGHAIAKNGSKVPDYDEKPVAAHMGLDEIEIHADLGQGDGQFTAWTSDLTHGYIDVNVDYRS